MLKPGVWNSDDGPDFVSVETLINGQLLYEGVMEALGYARNRKPFRELAQRVPFAQLMGKSDEEIQAVLFGVAGLLPSQSQSQIEWHGSDKVFIKRLEAFWEAVEQHKNPTSYDPGTVAFCQNTPRKLSNPPYSYYQSTPQSVLRQPDDGFSTVD